MKTSNLKNHQTILLVSFIFLFVSSIAQDYVCNFNIFGSKMQYKYSDGFTNYDIQVKGKIKVNNDDTGIESNSQGKLNYEYYEGRTKVPYEPEGRKWMADVLLEITRMTGIDAEGRTKRIYSKNGVDGVLEEISAISSNLIMATYFEALLDNFSLSTDEMLAVSSSIAGEISSNAERGRLFRDYSDVFLKNNTTTVGYFNSISRLSSNTERGSILTHISNKIDFNDPQVTEAYFACIDKMSSNTERGRVLRYAERTQDLSMQAYTRLLMSVKKLSSNTEMGSVLRSIKELDLESTKIIEAYFLAINSISSNTESGSVLRYTLQNHAMNNNSWVQFFTVTSRLSSNTEMGSVLSYAIDYMPFDNEEAVDGFFFAASKFSSSTEHARVLRTMISNQAFNKYTAYKLLESARKISSNTEKGSVLVRLCDTEFVKDPEIKKLYMNTAKTLTSDSEYRRVIGKLVE